MENEGLRLCPLLSGIAEEDFPALLRCLDGQRRTFPRDSFVFRAGDNPRYIGIVLRGSVRVIQEDFWGNRTILTHISTGGLFGEAFSCGEAESLPVSVLAAEQTEIMLIDGRKIIANCPNACGFHGQLSANMLRILARKNILLTRKMEHISRRTMREKVLSFLSDEAVKAGGNTLVIPYNRQGLADFLCVERSALSRALAEMKRDGILDYDKNKFTLYTTGKDDPQ